MPQGKRQAEGQLWGQNPCHRGKQFWRILAIILSLMAVLFLVKAAIALFPYLNLPNVTKESLDGLQLDGCQNVMFVAHPDDELLWGGKHLRAGDYLVVCLSRGDDKVRRAEFEKVLEATGDKGLILSYPDKILNWRADWKFWQGKIEADVVSILQYKDWELVVSHNAQGEYGHPHHKMAHGIVEKEYRDTGCKANLYWFGKYYVNDKIPYGLTEMDKPSYIQKRKIAKLYQSQRDTIRKMYHMLPYEEWEPYPMQ